VPNIEIVTLDRVDLKVELWSWPFATARRAEIEHYFAEFQRKRSRVWNGRALMMNRYAIADGVLRGTCFETDYASLCAWRDWRFPDTNVYNVFAAAALQSADGAYLVGEMASDTAAAGLIYFPCGTPEPVDIGADGAVDLAGSLRRELREETGLDAGELSEVNGWTFVRDHGFAALLKRVVAQQSAEELRDRITRFLAGEAWPELVDIRIVRSAADFRPLMPSFVTGFIEHAWAK